MKKVIAVVIAAVLVAGIAYLLVWMNETEYTGVCSFSIAGESRKLELAEVNRIDKDGKAVYSVLFSEGGDSFEFGFVMWNEDGEYWIDVDNPTVQIDGVKYNMSRPLGAGDITLDVSDDWMKITFWELQFNGGSTLNGSVNLMVSGGKLC